MFINVLKYSWRLIRHYFSDKNATNSFIFFIGMTLGLIILYTVFMSIGIKNLAQCKNSFGTAKIEEKSKTKAENNEKYFYYDAESLDDITLAVEMAEKVRVLCWVMTYPENHEKKAVHVKYTWGHRCNQLLFMSTKADKKLPTVVLPVKEGKQFLWGKTKAAFRYVYEHHREDADWFFKSDDDTYTIVENLRLLLSSYDSRQLLYFGFRFSPFTEQGYMSGGAGYVISRGALDVLYKDGLNGKTLCEMENERSEDVELGICLYKLGVKAMDSRDTFGRGRFFPANVEYHFFPPKHEYWYWKYNYYNTTDGLECCSDFAITFHYVPPQQMYVYDYFVYRLRPHGIKFNMDQPIPSTVVTTNTSKNTETTSETSRKNTSTSIKKPTSGTALKKPIKPDYRKGIYVPYLKDKQEIRNLIPYTHFYPKGV